MNYTEDEFLGMIRECLTELYENEKILFERNLCERCLVFRFGFHLQEKFNDKSWRGKYFVDCDFNSSSYLDENGKWRTRDGKLIEDQKTGKLKKRFIDIIVHRREDNGESDLICFEVKKWNNQRKEAMKKDEDNLKKLTMVYGYLFGFHLIFGATREDCEVTIFANGKVKVERRKIFPMVKVKKARGTSKKDLLDS